MKLLNLNLKILDKDKICGIVGDLANMETLYIFKELFNKTLNTQKYESRSRSFLFKSNKRENYLFNSSINGIEESDFIFLVGSNPRYEATILNARIRKAYLANKTKIISLNDVGDLTYPYQSLDGNTQNIKDIIDDKHEISRLIIKAKKPIIIFGQIFIKSKSFKIYI